MKDKIRRAKAGIRMDAMSRANLVFEIIMTNKTNVYLSKEYGISASAVSRLRTRVRAQLVRFPEARRLYRSDGRIFWDSRDER